MLLTEDLRQNLPPLYATENERVKIVRMAFWIPANDWKYYPIEFDGEDLFWGLVKGDFDELGYFSLSELEENGAETIEDFKPTLLSDLMK